MVLGELLVPGRPTNLDKSRAGADCACSRCGRGLFGHFSLFCHFSFLSPSLWETARYRLKYCLKGPLSQRQPTNQQMETTRRPGPEVIKLFFMLNSIEHEIFNTRK